MRKVSLVLVSPSMLIALNVWSAMRLAISRSGDSGMFASVTTNESSVAMFGWIIPAPFAVPMARMTLPEPSVFAATTCLGFVSVVMIARAKSEKAVWLGWISAIAFVIRAIGSCQPMTPVLATAIS
jgi:hypothetical protein